MSEKTTITAGLPATLYEQFAATVDRAGTDEETQLVELVRDHVELAKSISTYVDRDTDGESNADEQRTATLAEVPPPVGHLLGFELTAVERGRAVVEFAAGPEHANPLGTLHGGVLCDIGDAAMGVAFASTLDAGESFATIELDAKFLKPVWEADLTATAEVVKSGRRIGLVECAVADGNGSLVATLNSVCMVLRGDEADGR